MCYAVRINSQKNMLKTVIVILCVLSASNVAMAADSSIRIVSDLLGREVAVPVVPRRIVALAPNITEIIFALGQEKRLVGVTAFSDYPPEAADIPSVGSYIHLDLERIVALQPDLCFAIKDGNPKEVAGRLEGFGIPVYAVDPRNLESVMETLTRVGELLNAGQQADRIVRDMRTRIRKIDRLVSRIEERPRVFFQIGVAPIVSVGSGTFIHELIVRAGGINVAQGVVPYPRFSREQVISAAPDIIIITSMARVAVFEKIRQEWLQWPGLPAARNDKIFIQESNLFDRPSPRLVDALELLVKLIHPELFEVMD
jgi:iron complex transport system substrate-binding protein